MVVFVFTKYAKRAFHRLPKFIQEKMKEKLTELKHHPDIFVVLKRLHNFNPATHRLRVGSYRLILQLKKHKKDHVEFSVLDIGDRKDIYR